MLGPSEGEKKFDGCGLRKTRIATGGGNSTGGIGATLECPQIKDGPCVESRSRDHWFQLTALRSLRQTAGATVCGPCPVAGMNEIEANIFFADRDIAVTRALAAATERRRQEAESATIDAELGRIFPNA